jgi:hypothetical protein
MQELSSNKAELRSAKSDKGGSDKDLPRQDRKGNIDATAGTGRITGSADYTEIIPFDIQR